MSEINCRWAGSDRPRVVAGRHANGCGDENCRACLPCPERHCQVCGKEHVTVDGRGDDQTCATCLSSTRTDGDSIADMSGRTLDEAIDKGVNSEAAMLAGPVGNVEAFGYRRMSALAGRIGAEWLEDCRDEDHPLWVLGTWDLLVREHYRQPSDIQATVDNTWAYLAGHLTRLAHDADFPFDELARDLRRCRGHLENVLSEGEREVYGAPCLRCEKPLLRDDQGEEESWWCERCKRRSNADQYRLAVREAYKANATRLPVVDLAVRIDVPAGTIRRWAAKSEHLDGTRIVTIPPQLPFVGMDSQGRKVYNVADAERLRDRNGEAEVA